MLARSPQIRMTDVYTADQVAQIALSVLREVGWSDATVYVTSTLTGWTVSVTRSQARLPVHIQASPGKAARVRETLREAIEPLI